MLGCREEDYQRNNEFYYMKYGHALAQKNPAPGVMNLQFR